MIERVGVGRTGVGVEWELGVDAREGLCMVGVEREGSHR